MLTVPASVLIFFLSHHFSIYIFGSRDYLAWRTNERTYSSNFTSEFGGSWIQSVIDWTWLDIDFFNEAIIRSYFWCTFRESTGIAHIHSLYRKFRRRSVICHSSRIQMWSDVHTSTIPSKPVQSHHSSAVFSESFFVWKPEYSGNAYRKWNRHDSSPPYVAMPIGARNEMTQLPVHWDVKDASAVVFQVEVLVERGLAGPSGLVGQVLRTVCSRVRANLLSNYLSLAAFTIAFPIV